MTVNKFLYVVGASTLAAYAGIHQVSIWIIGGAILVGGSMMVAITHRPPQ